MAEQISYPHTRAYAEPGESPSVNDPTVCHELGGISRRHLRRLVRDGKLTRSNNKRRITRDSLTLEIERRKADIQADMTDISALSTEKRRTSELPQERKEPDSGGEMLMRFPNDKCDTRPVTELVSIPRVAVLLGITDDALRRAVEDEQIPSVLVGRRRKIDTTTLRSWARGEKVGVSK